MKIQFTPVSYQSHLKNDVKQKSQNVVNYSYNPAAYKDYNVSFGARLFRSPENFYEQDFNKNGMPKTLHKYIYNPDNFKFRRTIPPAQAMKEVFGPIAYLTSLEQVKQAYPEEPLFKDLHSTPSKNARTGVLGELALMNADKDYENKTLFKNGKNDLGMYIVKKIYVEGKTLKEINKDFHSDISVAYKGLSDIQYSDLKAFGIHFPDSGFWKSFTATREDFPYVFIPRTEHPVTVVEKPAPKPPRKTMDYTQRKRMSEFMINWHANLTPEEKAALIQKQKLAIEDTPLHKYFSEIVTIAQDKVNLAGIMADYFEKLYGTPDYEEFLQSHREKQSEIMTKFWKKHDMLKNQYSKAMIDTIGEFDKAYGQDGTSDDLTLLIEIAQEISEKNEKNRQLRRLEREAAASQKIEEKTVVKPVYNFNKPEVKPVVKKNVYKLDDNFEIELKTDLREAYHMKLEDKYSHMPKNFVNKVEKNIQKDPAFTDKYLVSAFYHDDKINERYLNNIQTIYHAGFLTNNIVRYLNKDDIKVLDAYKDKLFGEDETRKISHALFQNFVEKNSDYVDTVKEVMIEALNAFPLSLFYEDTMSNLKNAFDKLAENNLLPRNRKDNSFPINLEDIEKGVTESLNMLDSRLISYMNPDEISDRLKTLGFSFSQNHINFINNQLQIYKNPLTNKEVLEITGILADKLINFNDFEIIKKDSDAYLIMNTSMNYFRSYPKTRKLFTEFLREKYVKPEKGYLRYFLEKNTPEALTNMKLEKIMADLWSQEGSRSAFEAYCFLDTNLMKQNIRPINADLYNRMMHLYQEAMSRRNNPDFYNRIKNLPENSSLDDIRRALLNKSINNK